jgi:hypothetical protein
VPAPQVTSFAALNEQLLADCRRRLDERPTRDLAFFHDLRASLYDAFEKRTGWVNSLSLVRYCGTDYSVPTAYGPS